MLRISRQPPKTVDELQETYRRRCAVSLEATLPALDAAHIRPYSDGGEHRLPNGILLLRDIHSVFDAGYVTITPELKFEVSQRIREEFENVRDYYALHGRDVPIPDDPTKRPESPALTCTTRTASSDELI